MTTTVNPSFSVSGKAVSVTAGASSANTSTITVTPTGGFTGSVALTAEVTSGPSGAQDPPSLSFGTTTPVSITGTAAGTASLTVNTTAATQAEVHYPVRKNGRWYEGAGTALACIMLLCIPSRRRAWLSTIIMLFLLAALAIGTSGCGSSGVISPSGGGGGTSDPGTTKGSYTITVTGTSGSLTGTNTITLTVN